MESKQKVNIPKLSKEEPEEKEECEKPKKEKRGMIFSFCPSNRAPRVKSTSASRCPPRSQKQRLKLNAQLWPLGGANGLSRLLARDIMHHA